MTINRRLNQLFFTEVSAVPLAAFRIIFGLLMLAGTVRFMAYGWVRELYITPDFFFSYYGFEWVKPLPGEWMYLPFITMIISSIGIIIGYHFRLAATLFFASFTYVELLDKTNYLNHYYLVSLLAFLLCWLPANARFSVDAARNPAISRQTIPAWTILILQLQIGIVYCCAGIAKINSDWLLEAQPLRTWLQGHRDLPLVGPLFATVWLAYVFSWFGCLYDLTIPFLLSSRKTRVVAFCFVIVFHVLTWLLFPIGLFPWVMIFSALIFFPASAHEKWMLPLERRWMKNRKIIDTGPGRQRPLTPREAPQIKLATILLVSYLSLQVLLPFRYLLYPGDLFWTEEGFRFSWRVMLMHKEGYATFYVVDPKSGGSIEIDNRNYLSPVQIDQMSTQPDMILQFAHYLGQEFRDTLLTFGQQHIHLQDPRIEADVFVSLNGRLHRQLADRKTNLAQEPYSLKHRSWVNDPSSSPR